MENDNKIVEFIIGKQETLEALWHVHNKLTESLEVCKQYDEIQKSKKKLDK